MCMIVKSDNSLDGKPESEKKNGYLEDYWRAGFDLQYPSIPERVERRVGVICKRSAVEDEEGGHVVQDEAELVRMKAALGHLPLCVDNRRSEAGHGGVVYHRTHLKQNQKNGSMSCLIYFVNKHRSHRLFYAIKFYFTPSE